MIIYNYKKHNYYNYISTTITIIVLDIVLLGIGEIVSLYISSIRTLTIITIIIVCRIMLDLIFAKLFLPSTINKPPYLGLEDHMNYYYYNFQQDHQQYFDQSYNNNYGEYWWFIWIIWSLLFIILNC